MVAPPDNDVLWARSLHFTHRDGSPRSPVSRSASGRARSSPSAARAAAARPPCCSVCPALVPPSGRGLVQQRPRAHDGPAGPRAAAPRPLRLDRPGPRPRPRAQRLGERRPPPAAARHRPPRAPRPPPLEWLDRLDIGDVRRQPPARARPRPSASASPSRARWPRPPRCSSRTSRRPRCTARTGAHVLRTLTTAARSHGSPSCWPPTTRRPPRSPTARSPLLDGRRVNTVHLPPVAERGRPEGRVLALRLARGAHPAVQLRRLLVATASAGTGFLLLCTLGHALTHPGGPGASLLRLAWCRSRWPRRSTSPWRWPAPTPAPARAPAWRRSAWARPA